MVKSLETALIKKRSILSIYFTAGFPKLDDTLPILNALEKTGKVDLVEIGFPFSDPIADGKVLQESSQLAIKNGMTLHYLLDLLKEAKSRIAIPIVLMGYLNPIIQYGVEKFCEAARDANVRGVIIPDLPYEVYEKEYENCFKMNGLSNILLITPESGEERIKMVMKRTQGFLYVVSASSTTGTTRGLNDEKTITYFNMIKSLERKMDMNIVKLVGFGISNAASFRQACKYADGAIIGSAFVKMLHETKDLKEGISQFIHSVK
ncbi:hypothetical protein CHS0354_023927 [Potamilus streckersoni]|uniref:tryptophan synthase n=1 Tax=Potamilus streckersoni TaxID=2493646 RepID=A0AAE0RZI2_9BIVA|nr:hypothetical protein CHS0354_023927 [Potamilus streckersoni]